jgi:hypothetical protein
MIENGQMKESLEKVAVLEDVEVQTFVRFGEYAYRGQYRTSKSSDREEKEVSPFSNHGSETSGGSSKMKRFRARRKLNVSEPDLRLSAKVPDNDFRRRFKALSFDENTAQPATSDPDLLLHVKLYVFATRY